MMFGFDDDVIRRMCEPRAVKSDSNAPMESRNTLDLCLAGARKISGDRDKVAAFRRVFGSGAGI